MITFSYDKGELKEATKWKNECESMLNEIMKIASIEDTTLEEVSEQNEEMVKMEITIWNAIGDVDTYEC